MGAGVATTTWDGVLRVEPDSTLWLASEVCKAREPWLAIFYCLLSDQDRVMLAVRHVDIQGDLR
jgi:hypothetical protein